CQGRCSGHRDVVKGQVRGGGRSGGGRRHRSGRPPSGPRTAGAVTTLLGRRGVLGRGRGRTGVVGARRPPEGGEEGGDHRGGPDGGDYPQAAATAGTDQDIEIKYAAHQHGPRPGGRGVGGAGASQRLEGGAGVADDVRAPARAGGEDAVIQEQIHGVV